MSIVFSCVSGVVIAVDIDQNCCCKSIATGESSGVGHRRVTLGWYRRPSWGVLLSAYQICMAKKCPVVAGHPRL